MAKCDKILLLFVIAVYQIFGDYESPAWSCFFYAGLSLYFVLNLTRELSYTFNLFDRLIVYSAMVFFVYFFLTEGLCFFDISQLFNTFILKSNVWLSGVVFIEVIFLTLTFYLVRNDKKRNSK